MNVNVNVNSSPKQATRKPNSPVHGDDTEKRHEALLYDG